MASAVTICNGALIKVGARRITSLNENTVEAKLCNDRYEENLKDLLRSHPWRFAVIWDSPATVANPTYDTKYENVYQVPANCLRVLETNCPIDLWTVEGDYISADIADLKIRYIRYITDANLMDENFRELLSLKLAVDLSYSLTQNATLRESLRTEYKETLKRARSYSAQEASPPRVYADSWLNSRRSGG